MRAAWMWLIGVTNALLLVLFLYALVRQGIPDRSDLAPVAALLAVAVTNLAGLLFWLKPGEEERLVLAVQMAELRKRLAALPTTVKAGDGRPPLSRRTSIVVVVVNVIAVIVVVRFSMREREP